MSDTNELKRYRKDALSIARDFGYDPKIIEKIKMAENEIQIGNIMISARRGGR